MSGIRTKLNYTEIIPTKNVNNKNKIEIHIKSLGNSKTDENVYDKFNEKAISIMNKINFIESRDHLKESFQKLRAFGAFIDASSNKPDK